MYIVILMQCKNVRISTIISIYDCFSFILTNSYLLYESTVLYIPYMHVKDLLDTWVNSINFFQHTLGKFEIFACNRQTPV